MRKIGYIVLVIAVLGLFSPGVSANHYFVHSGYDHPAEGSPVYPQPVSFWDLPLWIIILQFACLPAEIFAVMKWWAFLGINRVSGGNVFENDTRQKIYECIRKNPGIHLRGIVKETNVSLGTLRYHINQLCKNHNLAILEGKGHTHYFENSGTYSVSQQNVLKHMRNATTRNILEVLAANPSATRKDIAESLGIAGSTITWHMKRLEEDGVIAIRNEGRFVQYHISESAVVAMAKTRHPTSV
ncbi:winged helix-turn-helix transcriptional regulator [Methanogenium cariaci]|jgi:predicted transcriptional regulator